MLKRKFESFRFSFQVIATLCIVACFQFSFSHGVVKDESFSLGYTHRWDAVNWNFGDPNDVPNILSELKWEDLCINQVTAKASFTTCGGMYIKAWGDYGQIYSGRNRDSDYLENNRQGEFSRSIANAGKGEVFDLSLALGYRATFFGEKLKIIPMFGASWNEQHLRMYDGMQVVPLEREINGLHSSYKTRWYGPWVGVDISFAFCDSMSFYIGVEHHWVEYRGRGHWNLRTDFLTDFKHFSNGDSNSIKSGISYSFFGNWGVELIIGYEEWQACNGTHRLTVEVPGVGPEGVVALLNQVSWHSFALTSMLKYSF
ncbi:MAG: hypothetical protein VX777_05525 [Chlamydiota bacterium]|nr:hypothetical protein [Chlamydiota bacterium]